MGFNQLSIALFGSVARGDNDRFSDNDLLLVSDDERTLREAKHKFDAFGWSCTAYSWARLQRAANDGSLFVQHLKQESLILSDPSERLSHLLANFTAKGSYKREGTSASNLVGNLMENIPDCAVGPMWSLDVLSVGFRSIAVANLAENGIYAFANSDILDGLAKIGLVKERDRVRLSALRRYKSMYRHGKVCNYIGWKEAFETLNLVNGVFSLGATPRRLKTIDALDIALKAELDPEAKVDWYSKCRRIESALLMLKPRSKNTRSEFKQQSEELLNLVRSPSSYAWHFTAGLELTTKKLLELATVSAI